MNAKQKKMFICYAFTNVCFQKMSCKLTVLRLKIKCKRIDKYFGWYLYILNIPSVYIDIEIKSNCYNNVHSNIKKTLFKISFVQV